MGIYEKLLEVQTALKCNKAQYNAFGKYYYRSLDDILESVKPLLKEQQLLLTIADEVVMVGERYYIKATATLVDAATGDKLTSTALAREDENVKGMSAGQSTGSSSSFARKYCLNGLFCIDDTKDLDGIDHTPQETAAPKEAAAKKEVKAVTAQQVADLQVLAKQKGVTVESIVNGYKLKTLQDISPQQWAQAMNGLKKRADV